MRHTCTRNLEWNCEWCGIEQLYDCINAIHSQRDIYCASTFTVCTEKRI